MRNPLLPPPAFKRLEGGDWRCCIDECNKVLTEEQRGDHRRAHNRAMAKRALEHGAEVRAGTSGKKSRKS